MHPSLDPKLSYLVTSHACVVLLSHLLTSHRSIIPYRCRPMVVVMLLAFQLVVQLYLSCYHHVVIVIPLQVFPFLFPFLLALPLPPIFCCFFHSNTYSRNFWNNCSPTFQQLQWQFNRLVQEHPIEMTWVGKNCHLDESNLNTIHL